MNAKWQSVALAALATAVFGLGLGCGERTRRFSKEVRFISVTNAPDGFQAWCFYWDLPQRDTNAYFEYEVLQPDGASYYKYDLTPLPSFAKRHHADFQKDLCGPDPKVFYNQRIKFAVRTVKGDLVFSPTGTYYFAFFKVSGKGQVNWKRPFKTVPAVIETAAAATNAPAPPPAQAQGK